MSSLLFDTQAMLIAEYTGLDSLGEALLLKSPTLRTLEEYVDLQFNRVYCEMWLGRLIGSSVEPSQFNWDRLGDLFKINRWVMGELEYLTGDDEEGAKNIGKDEEPAFLLVGMDS
ncbi:hypothetical protein JAAARDRAFT_201026 [Jaapia argillacea MUCL 33604]|uniref:Uncharacterized protein n=1 Tax=Jaapia argillacea MUCL 33604 TaxID=933084 RepID=A0A067P5X6_9AGAM|nr:hypothetical protein JAAARDRAFT_201026 [Jaapia argillacea MUCL 33604]